MSPFYGSVSNESIEMSLFINILQVQVYPQASIPDLKDEGFVVGPGMHSVATLAYNKVKVYDSGDTLGVPYNIGFISPWHSAWF